MTACDERSSIWAPFWATVALFLLLATMHLVERTFVPWARSVAASWKEGRSDARRAASKDEPEPAPVPEPTPKSDVEGPLPEPPSEIEPVADDEQLLVYLINRARHDPAAYQAANDLPPEVGKLAPCPPLAVQPHLFTSARFHAREMAEHRYFDHRSEKTGDWPNKMVRDTGYRLPDYFSDMANQVESIAAGMPGAATALQLLIRDEGVDPPDHRSHLLGGSEFHRQCREVGVGFATNPATTYGSYWAIHATWSAADAIYLTGVVFQDGNKNGRFDRGEGSPGTVIRAGRQVTRSNSAGGWSLRVDAGVYRVSIDDPTWSSPAPTLIHVQRDNVHVEFVEGEPQARVGFLTP